MKKVLSSLAIGLLLPSMAMSMEIYKKDDVSLSAGWWGQAWYQYVSDMDTNDDGVYDDDLNDFLIRRSYFYLKGTVTPDLSFFVHFAGDKLGMDEITNNSGKGLGSGIALRDGWITYKVADDNFMVQVGRMYVPFTRNYGTTSTKSMLTADLDWGQAGLRSGIFYPNNIGRDDSITLWGNILDDKLQYRFMVGDGEEDNAKNPDDNMRYAGRLSYNFFDPETKWFNAGTYLGAKHVLALGAGYDYEKKMVIGEDEDDYSGWTVDLHYDQPLASGDNLTVAASYIEVSHSANGISWTDFSAGDDGSLISAKAGYYFGGKVGPGNLQPYVSYQNVSSDETGDDDTNFYGIGLNYYIKGAGNKITLDATFVDQDEEDQHTLVQDHTIVTLQFAAGF
ncbi:MAG: porin [Desulfobulbaceae bacterium]|nr:porin [Desulfobulbaceae bacterium]